MRRSEGIGCLEEMQQEKGQMLRAACCLPRAQLWLREGASAQEQTDTHAGFRRTRKEQQAVHITWISPRFQRSCRKGCARTASLTLLTRRQQQEQ